SATLRTEGIARTLPSAAAGALERALQEALSNARRHAPGQPVEVGLAWQDDVVSLTVSNPVAVPASAHAGGGYGLIGMRERFAGLAGGAAEAGIRDGRFVVRVRADVS
ncbi:MAG: two-component sensor histidine kinase, partial [Microbacterium sp.]|nr:two-component sensor histidine kinase [Microbacterium sp.]